MNSLPSPILLNPKIHKHLIPSIAATHASCIIHPPYSGGTFMPPIDTAKMEAWWTSRVTEVEEGTREILIQTISREGNMKGSNQEVVGVVMLSMPFAETGSFRGFVEKLCVKLEWRGKGIAARLMGMLDRVAVEKGRLLLMLDTEGGSPAEMMYPRWGWTLIGTIPRYEISPGDGSLKDAVFFYKDLR